MSQTEITSEYELQIDEQELETVYIKFEIPDTSYNAIEPYNISTDLKEECCIQEEFLDIKQEMTEDIEMPIDSGTNGIPSTSTESTVDGQKNKVKAIEIRELATLMKKYETVIKDNEELRTKLNGKNYIINNYQQLIMAYKNEIKKLKTDKDKYSYKVQRKITKY